MKAVSLFVPGLAVAILSIAPANAQKYEDKWKCSTTTWPMVSPVQCAKPKASNYVECTRMLMDKGWRAADTWYGCTNQGFKS
jgi:hypothetical protein